MIIALAITASVLALGFGSVSAPADETDTSPAVAASESIPVLPTVVVNAKAEIPMLPVVVVHPTAAEREEAMAIGPIRQVSLTGGSTSPLIEDILPHVRLDMPYYSFGKMVPRAIKE
jgi:hypothetical protein